MSLKTVKAAKNFLGVPYHGKGSTGRYLLWGNGRIYELFMSEPKWRAVKLTPQELAMDARLRIK